MVSLSLLDVPSGGDVDESFNSAAHSSRSAHIAEMNEIYDEQELNEALISTNEIIAEVRERKDELFRELASAIVR